MTTPSKPTLSARVKNRPSLSVTPTVVKKSGVTPITLLVASPTCCNGGAAQNRPIRQTNRLDSCSLLQSVHQSIIESEPCSSFG